MFLYHLVINRSADTILKFTRYWSPIKHYCDTFVDNFSHFFPPLILKICFNSFLNVKEWMEWKKDSFGWKASEIRLYREIRYLVNRWDGRIGKRCSQDGAQNLSNPTHADRTLIGTRLVCLGSLYSGVRSRKFKSIFREKKKRYLKHFYAAPVVFYVLHIIIVYYTVHCTSPSDLYTIVIHFNAQRIVIRNGDPWRSVPR